MHILLFTAALSCPVLNTATAQDKIGDLQATVTHAKKTAAYTCVFTNAEYKLTVEVTPLAAPDRFARFKQRACRDSREEIPLKGIGNEAVACSTRLVRVEETIAGRVRDQAFVVSMSTADRMAENKNLRSKITVLAEEVAGNLF